MGVLGLFATPVMRLWFLLSLGLILVSNVEGQGFLQNIVNRFNPFRPQQSSRPRPPARPRPSSPARPAPTFQSRPVPAPQPAPIRPSSSSGISEIPAPSLGQQSQPPARPQQSGSASGNHVFQGRNYILSWREGRNSFSWDAARSYCSSRGMRIVSLDTTAKRDHFMQQVAADGSPYFWAGGRLSSDKRSVRWENGRSEGISKGRHPWSFTGSRGAQPDGQGSEHCLAILNNFYNDGVKFHDVGCSHRKPTVCEA